MAENPEHTGEEFVLGAVACDALSRQKPDEGLADGRFHPRRGSDR
jgi:hypothetical protein